MVFGSSMFVPEALLIVFGRARFAPEEFLMAPDRIRFAPGALLIVLIGPEFCFGVRPAFQFLGLANHLTFGRLGDVFQFCLGT